MNTFKNKIFKCINYKIKQLNKFKDILLINVKYINEFI